MQRYYPGQQMTLPQQELQNLVAIYRSKGKGSELGGMARWSK